MPRQSNSDEHFRELLCAICNGNITHAHWEMLLGRSPLRASNKTDFKNATHLFFDKESVVEYNYQSLQTLGNVIAKIEAVNSDYTAKATKSDEAGGLDSVIFLTKHAKVMLTSNLWQQAGLCNGTTSIVEDIIYTKNQNPPSLPISIIVEFEKYTGPPFITDHPTWVPIPPITYEWTTSQRHSRKQLPLRLCYAMTIHKSQGQTLEKAVIDLGDRERTAGLIFVALSRLRHLNDLLVKPMTFKRLETISKSKVIHTRIHEEERLQKIHNSTELQFE